MQSLETLLGVLGITQHMEALSNWRDALLIEKAAELKTVHDERDAITAEFAAYKSTAEAAIKAAKDAIDDTKLSDKLTVKAISEIVAEVVKPAEEREQESIKKQIAELQAKLAK